MMHVRTGSYSKCFLCVTRGHALQAFISRIPEHIVFEHMKTLSIYATEIRDLNSCVLNMKDLKCHLKRN